jgi:hypothetical protein
VDLVAFRLTARRTQAGQEAAAAAGITQVWGVSVLLGKATLAGMAIIEEARLLAAAVLSQPEATR